MMSDFFKFAINSSLLVSLSVIASSVGVGQPAGGSEIYGVYQQCHMACTTIRLNPNKTFDYVLSGNLYNDIRVKGQWSVIDKHKLKAQSNPVEISLQVKEQLISSSQNLLVEIIDANGATMPATKVRCVSAENIQGTITNGDGVATLPRCQELEFEAYEHKARYKLQGSETSLLTVTFPVPAEPVIDEIWLIQGTQLFVNDINGSPLKRLNSKEASRMFPTKGKEPK